MDNSKQTVKFKRASYTSPGKEGKRGFEDLDCYKLALDIVVNVHEMVKYLPLEEKYDLSMQIRRSSKSITANIAEGYGRYHYQDSLKSYSIARGELNETLSHLINAYNLGYIEQEFFNQLYDLIRQAEAALNGFMNYVRRRSAGGDLNDHGIREEGSGYIHGLPSTENECDIN